MKEKTKRKIILLVVESMIAVFIIAKMTIPMRTSEIDESSTYYKEYHIEKGDSMWSVAEKYKPDSVTTKEFVNEIADLNNLSSDHKITEGKYILIPIKENKKNND